MTDITIKNHSRDPIMITIVKRETESMPSFMMDLTEEEKQRPFRAVLREQESDTFSFTENHILGVETL